MGCNLCKLNVEMVEDPTLIILRPKNISQKDVTDSLNFSFEKAVNLLESLDSKKLSVKYFQKGKQIQQKGVFITQIVLNNRLKQAIYKVADFRESNNTSNALKLLNEYIVILKLRECKHILRRYGYCINYENKTINFLYEHLEGNLESLIEMKSLDIDKKLRIMSALITTLMFVHSRGIVLVDLSPRNIMFDYNWRLRFTKFENAINIEKPFWNREITLLSRTNVAPEILINSNDVLPYSDIWSLGIIFTQLFTGITNYLYQERTKNINDLEFKNNYYSKIENKVLPFIVDKIEHPLKKAFVLGLLRFEPIERPDIFDVAEVINKMCCYFQIEMIIPIDERLKEDYKKRMENRM